MSLGRAFALVLLTGSLAVHASPLKAQSSGLSGSSSQLKINQIEAEAFQKLGEQGGSLVPKTNVSRCEDQKTSIGSAPTRKSIFDLPKSLLDEELETGGSNNTTVIGDTVVICQ